ncbi:unnamed protein product [Rangifer tarandus platyrhynchus]|uniref:Uncharacterized protein n=2 Tax=Rangifer tarandus platyrhynchus TaxID=3082113 RepID=A0ACB0FIH0_RANTA|nr:unnamed protein product [Rangifer tarandus platyrhynchus]CAI9712877.1 unnamed protein product [Rangifer tarandus platyrhynchus]
MQPWPAGSLPELGRHSPGPSPRAAFPEVHTKRAVSPAAQTQAGAHGSRGGGGIGLRSGRRHPSHPRPATLRHTRRFGSPGGPPPLWGWGSGRKKTHVAVPGQEKVWFPPSFPRRSALADLRGAGPAEPARSALCSELGPEGEGRGLGSHLRTAPPPHQPCAQTPCWPPPAPETARFHPPGEARLRLGLPEGPGAHKLSSGRRPHAPRSLGPPGSDRCLRDRLSFVPKEKGTRAGSPAPPPAPRPSRCPHPQLSLSGGPLPGPAAAGAGGRPAVSNVHF